MSHGQGWAGALLGVTLLATALPACGGGRKGPAVGRVEEGRKPAARPEAPDEPGETGVKPGGGRPRVPAAPEALLAPGSLGDLQRALAERGYLKQHRQGELDTATSAALERFQRDQGLASTGVPDRETLRRLGLSAEKAYGRGPGEGGEARP